MKFAVIGSAHNHIHEFIDDMLSSNNEFIGIYDDNTEISKNISEKYTVPLFNSMEELFDSGIEVAGTTAVNSEKIDIIEKCNEHGVHIMADKPIAINDEQYKRLKKVIDEGRIEVGLMLTIRFMSEVQAIKELLRNETIGKLLSVEIFNPHRLMAATRPEWHFEEELNGGIVTDLIVHSVDLYRWFTESDIDSYTGLKQKSILKEKKSFYDCAQFLVTSKNGTSGYFRVDWHMTDTHWNWGDMRVFCTGSKGCLEARCLGDPLTRESLLILYEEGKETVRLNVDKCTQTVIKDFLNRINKKDYIIGHDDILAACRTSLNLSNSAKKYTME